MTPQPRQTIEVKIERLIPAPAADVFDGWLDPKIPGTPWNVAEKYLLNAQADGLFYWALKGMAHYGRFVELKKPALIRYTWVSPNTLGQESTVTVTFKAQGDGTLMTLVHSGLPDTGEARGHERGWDYFTGVFCEQFGPGSRKKFRWEEAHPSPEA